MPRAYYLGFQVGGGRFGKRPICRCFIAYATIWIIIFMTPLFAKWKIMFLYSLVLSVKYFIQWIHSLRESHMLATVVYSVYRNVNVI